MPKWSFEKDMAKICVDYGIIKTVNNFHVTLQNFNELKLHLDCYP